MPSGDYDRHTRAHKDECIIEIRNYLKCMVNKDSLTYFVGLYERMSLQRVKHELRILAGHERYKNRWEGI